MNIGHKDALTYHPELGARLISEAIDNCGNNAECTGSYLRQSYKFDSFGVLRGNFILKRVEKSRFRVLN